MTRAFVRTERGVHRVIVQGERNGKPYQETVASGLTDKREANRIKNAVNVELQRKRAGVSTVSPTVKATIEAYLESLEGRSSQDAYSRYARLHVLPTLGEIELGDLDVTHVQAVVDHMATKGYSAQTVIHAVSVLRAAINRTKRRKVWRGENPCEDTDLVLPKLKRRAVHILTPEESPYVLDELAEEMRPYVATVLATAVRPKDVVRIPPASVHLDRRVIHLLDTKTGDEQIVQIPEWLVPYLETALRHARDGKLFPGDRGENRHAWKKLTPMLRSAMVRAALKHGVASLVTGWTLKCRRKGCGFAEEARAPSTRPCPTCGFALWPVGHARPVTFRNLRHTTATNMIEQGVDVAVVSAVLGHADPRITMKRYVVLSEKKMAAALNKVGLPPKKTGGEHTAPALRESKRGKK